MWRAIRYGLDGRMIDFERGEEYPSSEIVERLLAWTAPARAELGLELALAVGPQRRAAPARDDRVGRDDARSVRERRARDARDLCRGGAGMSGEEQAQPSEEELRRPGRSSCDA